MQGVFQQQETLLLLVWLWLLLVCYTLIRVPMGRYAGIVEITLSSFCSLSFLKQTRESFEEDSLVLPTLLSRKLQINWSWTVLVKSFQFAAIVCVCVCVCVCVRARARFPASGGWGGIRRRLCLYIRTGVILKKVPSTEKWERSAVNSCPFEGNGHSISGL